MSELDRSPLLAPFISYTVLHQALPTVPPAEYRQTMRAFHERLHEETRKLRRPAPPDHPDFLPPGLTASTEAEVSSVDLASERAKSLQEQGALYLRSLGFAADLRKQPLFESAFIVRGSLNLDVLEYLVRDVLGIYATTHGKHIREFGHYGYSLYNLIYPDEIAPMAEGDGAGQEATMYFSKPAPDVVKYEPFRRSLSKLFRTLQSRSALDSITLWQRKLGLGTGVEFVLRLRAPTTGAFDSFVGMIEADPEIDSHVRRALLTDGKLVVKNVILTLGM